MNKIKFRAWHKEYKTYYKVEEIYFGIKQVRLCGKHPHHEEPEIIFRAKFDEIILEQYIGLKDENGNEIYEGDLVSLLPPETLIYAVSYVNGRYLSILEDDYSNSHYWIPEDFEILEIIGNIHEGVKE